MKHYILHKVMHLVHFLLKRNQLNNLQPVLVRTLPVLLFLILAGSLDVKAVTTYYYNGTGRLDRQVSWGINTDGSGSNPANFTAAGQVFEIRNCTSVSLSRNWTVSGAGSKVVLGNATQPAITMSHSNGDFEAVLDIASASSGSNTYDVSTTSDRKVATLGTLSSGSTVDYSRGGAQNVQAASYYNLTLSSSGTKTAAANFSVSGVLNIAAGVTLDMTTFALTGTFTTSGTGTLETQKLSEALAENITWVFTVLYNASGAQTIVDGNYTNLNVSGGNRTFTPTGTVGIAGTFTPGTGAFTLTNSTIEFNGSSAQSVPTVFTSLNNLTINNSNGVSLPQALAITGVLNFSAGSLVLNGQTLTLSGTCSGTTSFTGSSASNLIINGSGDLGSSINMVQTSSATRTINTITINRTSGTVTLGNPMEVTGTVNVTTGTLASGGNLTLVSNATGTARVGALSGGADITGDVTVQRFIPASTRRYRYFSSPVSSFTYAQLIDDIFFTGSGGVSNGFDAGTNSATSYTYNDNPTSGRGWKPVTNITQSLAAGMGFNCFIRGDRTLPSPDWYTINNARYPSTGGFPAQNAVTIDFTGPLNKNVVTPTVSYTATATPGDDGWNLIGNPYASPIDWSLVTKSNLESFIYMFDPVTNGFIANDGSAPIAVGQAFFVKANAASPTVTFDENCKTTSSPTSYFKSGTPTNRFTIRMIRDSLNSDIAWLRIKNGASMNYVSSEDAAKFMNSSINMGFKVQPGPVNVQLNTVPPLTNTADTFVIFTTGPINTYKLEFTQLQNIPETKSIMLRDLFTNTSTDIRVNQLYDFSITADLASKGDRFQLIIINQSALPVKLVKFEAKRSMNNKDVEINWSTASETNSQSFVVERSINNVTDFKEITSIAAAGNSFSMRDYNHNDIGVMDELGANGMIYYRLKGIDIDGSVNYSDISAVEVNKVKVSDISVFPNPVSENLFVKTNIPLVKNLSYEVFDISGRLVMSGKSGAEGLGVSHLVSGNYIVRFSGDAVVNPVSLKFTKVESRGKRKIPAGKISSIMPADMDIDSKP